MVACRPLKVKVRERLWSSLKVTVTSHVFVNLSQTLTKALLLPKPNHIQDFLVKLRSVVLLFVYCKQCWGVMNDV